MLTKFLLLAALASAIFWLGMAQNSDEGNVYNDEVISSDNQLATETVTEFLDKFGTLAASTADVGAFMERVSLSAFALLKLGFPVGAIIAGSLQISTKTESEEYKALANLRDSMQKNFVQIKRAINVAEQVIGMERKLDDYTNKVHVPFENLMVHMRHFWDPATDKKPESVEIFSKACYTTDLINTPLGILNYIWTHTVDNCKMGLRPGQVALLSKFVPLLQKIRVKLGDQTERAQFTESMPDLTNWFMEIETKVARTLLLKMENLIDTSDFESAQEVLNIMKAVLFENEEEPIYNSKCLLLDIIIGKNFHRKSIEEMQNIIRLDTLKLVMYGSFCANVSFKGNPTEILWFQSEILLKAVPIMDHVQLFVENELEKTFPKIEIGLVQSKIDQMKLTAPVRENATIFKVMVEVFNELNQYGNRKYNRQGFVSTNLQNDTNFVLRCYSENCFAVLDYASLNVVVTRFDADNDEIRAVDAYEWLYRFDPYAQTDISRLLAKYIETYYDIDKVSVLLDRFERRHFPLTNEDYFHNVAILRDYGGSTGKCAVQASAFYYPFANYTETCTVTYYFAGSFFHACESYIVYLFV